MTIQIIPPPLVDAILNIVFGALLLLAGRRVLWLFSGLITLLLAILLAGLLFELLSLPEPGLIVVLAIVVIGFAIGVLIERVLPVVGVGFVGLVSGGYIAGKLVELFGWTQPARMEDPLQVGLVIVIVVLGAVAGLVFARRFPIDAPILFSTVIGATGIVLGFGTIFNTPLNELMTTPTEDEISKLYQLILGTPPSAIFWLALMLIGVIAQYYQVRRAEIERKRKAIALIYGASPLMDQPAGKSRWFRS